ncbi:MAG: metallophosphoesterase family protein [Longimicrobiales bacterium]
MLTILHASDVHLGPPYVPAAGDALVRAAEELDPDVIVASGDFTQRAKREQYAAARALLGRLPARPLVVVPGNHDVPLFRVFERVFTPYRNYREFISPDLDAVLRVEGATFVALNSTAPLRAITNGRIREWQLDLCEHAFATTAAGDARIVVAHHHFAPAPDYEGGQVMPRARRALDRFTSFKVDLIMGGHLHRAYIGNSLDVYSGVDRTHGIIIAQSGTTTSRRGRAREREKNSFNLIRIGDDIIRITQYMFFDEVGGFAPVSRHIFPRPGTHYFRDRGRLDEGSALAPPVGVRERFD